MLKDGKLLFLIHYVVISFHLVRSTNWLMCSSVSKIVKKLKLLAFTALFTLKQKNINVFMFKGYVAPGMEIAFEVEFHPTHFSQDIRYEGLLCHVENHLPLNLTLTGMCVQANLLKDVIFEF